MLRRTIACSGLDKNPRERPTAPVMLPRHKPICRRPPAPPVNALTTRATALLLLQRPQLADLRDPLAFQSSEHFTVIGAEDLGATLLDTFSEDFDLREQYTEIYDRLLKEHPGITGANAAHNALVEVIIANRDRSPPECFAIHTQMPVGGSVTTFIEPASGVSSTAFNAMESAVKRARSARVAEMPALGENAADEACSVHDFRDRVAAHYRAA